MIYHIRVWDAKKKSCMDYKLADTHMARQFAYHAEKEGLAWDCINADKGDLIRDYGE